ncbi:hypothetical protein HPO96_37095 [Kribbella sandramycini]|uniref:Uncharacterized protein n=1 Tax=Kribbella sandramycini TaxID=60450 RepID=A0A7Y4L7N6_9ACTN|nr:hypothetical protein [Kribbella sandramycini]MBB6564416.1 hypothetical protein [Kribbella sandramycini]NOL45877.1 hypothetical protein [Kribbella sandramycini]
MMFNLPNAEHGSAFPVPMLDVPRVQLPGVDRDAVDALHAEMDATRVLRWRYSLAMARTGKHVYTGTVPSATKTARRRRNKAARVARRAGR